MSLRVLALAAPQFIAGDVGKRALSSADPASLYNACRIAAQRAEQGSGAWGDSNWADGRHARRQSTLLLHSLDQMEDIVPELVARDAPNLVLIGAMSICLPGAIATAQRIRQLLGDRVCIVLGGRHATESVYKPRGAADVAHHASSPLKLAAEGAIPDVFDIVVSGDGEYVLAEIGELVARLERQGRPAAEARSHLDELTAAPGKWLAGTVAGDAIRTVQGAGGPLNFDKLPPPCALFGVGTKFDCFGGRPTAHVFSDVGRGCIYDCAFCSERRSVTGMPAMLDTSADRLFRQLEAATRIIEADYPGQGASAFIEDSTILTGSPALCQRLIDRLQAANLNLRFGGQFTIDQILSRPRLIEDLHAVGLDYLFIGLETFSPEAIGGMSKDVKRKSAPWSERAEAVFQLLDDLDMQCGAAVLFGLGEPHSNRLALVDAIHGWRGKYGFPNPVSMNWAVQHPLMGDDGGTNYTYTEWSLPRGPALDVLRDFGEASVTYPLAGQAPPQLADAIELRSAIASLPEKPRRSAGQLSPTALQRRAIRRRSDSARASARDAWRPHVPAASAAHDTPSARRSASSTPIRVEETPCASPSASTSGWLGSLPVLS